MTLDKIDRCMCGAVQGFFYLPGETPPFQGKGQNGAHSPLGCFRQGGGPVEIWKLYREATGGFAPEGASYWVQMQVIFSWLKHTPERARTLPVVLTPTLMIPPRAYPGTPPATPPKRGGGVVRGTPVPSPARVPWDPATNPIKPPWEK